MVYRHLPAGSEFLIEEGGSVDGTKEILKDLNKRWPFLKINYSNQKEGFATAARKLYEQAQCPLVFFSDSDGQCVAAEFWKLVPHAREAALVLGAKRIRRDPFTRRILSRGFNWLVRRLFGLSCRDINFGFRLCRREIALKYLRSCREMPTMINAELVLLATMGNEAVREVTIHHRPRLYGSRQGFTGPMLEEAGSAFLALLRIRRNDVTNRETSTIEAETRP